MSIRLFIFLFNLRHLIISDGCIDAQLMLSLMGNVVKVRERSAS
jgi:hypothetical protein